MEELRDKLLDWAKQFETPDFIKDDPIFFPHKYNDKKDIEISAFLTSWIAFGNRKLIMQQAEILDNLMGNSPYAFIMNKVWEQYKENTNTFYRMFTMTSSAFASGCTTYIRNGMIWKYFMRVTTMLSVKYKQILVA
jgi:uncharacterized protein (TIGR02757 family)